jgi:hypothetical protein
MAIVENPMEHGKMTPEVVKKLEDVFAMDGSVEEACFYADISKQCYYNWIDSFPELKERFDALRLKPILKARNTVIKALEDPKYATWYLTKKKRKEFGDSLLEEVTGRVYQLLKTDLETKEKIETVNELKEENNIKQDVTNIDTNIQTTSEATGNIAEPEKI